MYVWDKHILAFSSPSSKKKKKSLLNDRSIPVKGGEIIFSQIQIYVKGCTVWHFEGDNIWQKQAQVLTCSRDLLPFCKWNRWGFWLTVSSFSSSARGLRMRLRSWTRTTSQIGISLEVWHERSNANNVNTISVSHVHPNVLICIFLYSVTKNSWCYIHTNLYILLTLLWTTKVNM